MGSVKSTFGKKLAESLLVDFYDLDKIIEAKLKKNIKDIFEEDGEGFFRDIENKSLNDFQNKTKFVLATGGGIITNKGSRNFFLIKNFYLLFLILKNDFFHYFLSSLQLHQYFFYQYQ